MSRDFPKQNQPINNFTKYFPCFPFTAGSLKSNRKFQVYKGEKTKVKEYENLSYLCAFWREARDGFVSFARGRNFMIFTFLSLMNHSILAGGLDGDDVQFPVT